jgi:hypothetical protein
LKDPYSPISESELAERIAKAEVEIARQHANRVKDRVMSEWKKISGEPKEESEPNEMGIVVTVDVDEKQSVAADGQETSQAQVETLNWL